MTPEGQTPETWQRLFEPESMVIPISPTQLNMSAAAEMEFTADIPASAFFRKSLVMLIFVIQHA